MGSAQSAARLPIRLITGNLVKNAYRRLMRATFGRPVSHAGRRLLVLRTDAIGDFVLFTPVLRAIRRAHPEYHVTLLVNVCCSNLAESCPYVDETVTFDP